MVAINSLALLAFLPALLVSAAPDFQNSPAVGGRNLARTHNDGLTAQRRYRKRHNNHKTCRPRTSTAAQASSESAVTPSGDATPSPVAAPDMGSENDEGKSYREGTAATQSTEGGSSPEWTEGDASSESTQGTAPANKWTEGDSSSEWTQDAPSSTAEDSWSSPTPTSASNEGDATSSAESSPWSSSVESSSAEPAPTAPPTDSSGGSGGNYHGVLTTSGPCGPCDATEEFPNGSEDWLMCNVRSGGWTPPFVPLDQVKMHDLTKMDMPLFTPCFEYMDLFVRIANEGEPIPPSILVAIAMQESTCNKDAIGWSRQEVGLMQILPSNCPDNCADPETNIRKGKEIFLNAMNQHGGNIVEAFGGYNGFAKGQTLQEMCGVNPDYAHQMLNLWFQGKDGSPDGPLRSSC